MNFSSAILEHALMRHQIIYVFLKVCLDRHAASVHQVTKNNIQVNQSKGQASPQGRRLSEQKPWGWAAFPNSSEFQIPFPVNCKGQLFKAFKFWKAKKYFKWSGGKSCGLRQINHMPYYSVDLNVHIQNRGKSVSSRKVVWVNMILD